MKKIICFLVLFLFTLNLKTFSQKIKLPENPKPGKCYALFKKNRSNQEWKEIDCELNNLTKKELTTIQIKLQNLKYDVDISGCIDEKTNKAYKREKKAKRKRIRKMKKELRKNKSIK